MSLGFPNGGPGFFCLDLLPGRSLMPKRAENRRAGWNRLSPVRERPEIGYASGRESRDTDRTPTVRRQGPYETSYHIENGYTMERRII